MWARSNAPASPQASVCSDDWRKHSALIRASSYSCRARFDLRDQLFRKSSQILGGPQYCSAPRAHERRPLFFGSSGGLGHPASLTGAGAACRLLNRRDPRPSRSTGHAGTPPSLRRSSATVASSPTGIILAITCATAPAASSLVSARLRGNPGWASTGEQSLRSAVDIAANSLTADRFKHRETEK